MRQRAQDLDPLAVADGQRADNLVGGEVVDLERGEQRVGLRPHRAPVDAARAARAARGRERCSRRPSVRETAAAPDRSSRRRRACASSGVAKRVARPSIEDRAGVGLVDAGHDLDQGRLARAVLAEQRMRLARADVERDAAERPHARECFFEIRAPRAAGPAMSERRSCGLCRECIRLDDDRPHAGVFEHRQRLTRRAGVGDERVDAASGQTTRLPRGANLEASARTISRSARLRSFVSASIGGESRE